MADEVRAFTDALARSWGDDEGFGSLLARQRALRAMEPLLRADFGGRLRANLASDAREGLRDGFPQDYRPLKAVLDPLVAKGAAEPGAAGGDRQVRVWVDYFGTRQSQLVTQEARRHLLSFVRAYAPPEAMAQMREHWPDFFRRAAQDPDSAWWERVLDEVRHCDKDWVALWRAEVTIGVLEHPRAEPRPDVLASLRAMRDEMRARGVVPWAGFHKDRGVRQAAAGQGYRPTGIHEAAPPPADPSGARVDVPPDRPRYPDVTLPAHLLPRTLRPGGHAVPPEPRDG